MQTGQFVGDRYPYATNKSMPTYKTEVKLVEELQSRYGYLTEDISTSQMRSRWIAGGKITIINLETKEVLAERIGFVFARRRDGSLDQTPWGYVVTSFCANGNSRLIDFVSSV
jgi:hypothetical protein